MRQADAINDPAVRAATRGDYYIRHDPKTFPIGERRDMPSDFSIKCRAVPIAEDGPLIPRLAEPGWFMSLHINESRSCPKGLNIDSLLIFDMQADGGLDAIEILVRLDSALKPGHIFPRWDEEQYWRLFLEPSHEAIGEPDVSVSVEWADHVLTCRWSDLAADTSYLLGPGVTALVGGGLLLAIQADLAGLAKH